MNERRISITAFIIGVLGLLVAIVVLFYRHGSKTPLEVILGTLIGIVPIIVVFWGYFGYTATRYRRLQSRTDATLERTPPTMTEIPQHVQEQLHELLKAAANEVASQQQLTQSQVRAALLLPEGQSLRMTRSLTWNIDDPNELEIRIGPGQGSSGRAFQTGKSNVAIYHDAHADSSLPEQERVRVDRNLKWIISTPILSGGDTAVGVLNVDGLTGKTEEDLVKSAGSLAYWAQLAGLILGLSPMR
jgi:hypothetical protein